MKRREYSKEEVDYMRKLLLEYLDAVEVLEQQQEEERKRKLTRGDIYKLSLELPWYTDIIIDIILCLLGLLVIIIVVIIYT